MITGDRKETAQAIAKEAGLLEIDDAIVITSTELNEMSDDEVKAKLPKFRVIARALPTDKSRLVRLAQELNLVVGMTGDGVNDSPALKKLPRKPLRSLYSTITSAQSVVLSSTVVRYSTLSASSSSSS